MYLTVKETHIAIDLRFKQLNSERKITIPSEVKDLCINRAILKFVEHKTKKKSNIKGIGFENDQKRYDDVRELKREVVLPTYQSSQYPDELVYSVLPADYHKLVNDRTERYWTCNDLVYEATSTDYRYVVLPFPTDITTGALVSSYYTAFAITINGAGVTLPSPLPLLYSPDAKFQLVHIVLDAINNNDPTQKYYIYWERYDNLYHYNSFIIVERETIPNAATITYLQKDNIGYLYNAVFSEISRDLISIDPSLETLVVPNELVGNEKFWDMIRSYYYTKNRNEKPLSYIYRNRLYVHHTNDFIPTNIHIQYIKQPNLVNLLLNQSCELSRMEEIVELAVQEIYAISGDPNYKAMLAEAQLTE